MIIESIALMHVRRLRTGGAWLVAAMSTCSSCLHNTNLGHLATPPDLRNRDGKGERSLATLAATLTT